MRFDDRHPKNMQNSPNISGWYGSVNCGFINIYIYIWPYIHTYVCINQNHGGFDSRFAKSSLHLYFETLKFKHKSWCRAKHGRMDPENVLPKQCYFRAVFQNQTRTLLSQHLQDESSVDACYGHVAGKPPPKKVGIWRCWCRDGTPRNVPQPATPDQTKAVQ